jgi:hypothetical protein
MEVLDVEESIEAESSPTLLLEGTEFVCSYEAIKKPFSKLWEAYLKMEHETAEYKRILVMIDEKVSVIWCHNVTGIALTS